MPQSTIGEASAATDIGATMMTELNEMSVGQRARQRDGADAMVSRELAPGGLIAGTSCESRGDDTIDPARANVLTFMRERIANGRPRGSACRTRGRAPSADPRP